MSWLDLFNGRKVAVIRTGAVPANADRSLAGSPDQVGSFSTVQTLVSFSGATLAVSVVERIIPENIGGISVLPTLCILVGLLIWIFNVTDPDVTPRPTRRDVIASFFVAVVNTAQLYLACLGGNSIVHH
jgi:hypothetical protein